MPTPTPVLGLQAAVATDLEPAYLTGGLATSLGTLDTLFDPLLGHTHVGAGQGGPLSVGGCVHEEFLPAAAATSVTLAQVPTSISSVARDGMVQSEADLHYSLGGQVLSFSIPFTGAERVVVEYALQTAGPAPPPYNGGGLVDNSVTSDKLVDPLTQPEIATPTILPPVGSRRLYPKADGAYYSLDSAGLETPVGGVGMSYVHEEYVPAAAATTITLAQTPAVVLVVAREGIVQSEVVPHYSTAGAVLTFAQPFDGLERVVVAYGWQA